MVMLWRWLLVFSTLAAGMAPAEAAGSRETRDYTAATEAFHDEMYGLAESEFAQFVHKYPKSGYAAEAELMQAEAELKQGKFAPAIALLSEREAEAGGLKDQYVYWLGEAQFQMRDYNAAAATFSRLARDFPGSALRLDATVDEAAARAKLGQWTQVSALLQKPGGAFQTAAKATPADERVMRGQLLLAEALLTQNHTGAAVAVLQSLAAQPLKPALDWQRTYLLCRVQLADGETNAALAATTNLLHLAQLEGRADWQAESVAMRADALKQSGRTGEAMAVYQENLTTNAPDQWQQQAVLKIAELAVAQHQFTNAEQSLSDFLRQFSNAPAADVALLTLGELHLKEYVASGQAEAATNQLLAAGAELDQFIGAFTNSALLGKAYLDRGWTFWLEGRTNECLTAFQAAARMLPPSVDLAVARFKLGDVQFAEKDYADARENYRAVAEDFTNFPVVVRTLRAQALYQLLNTCNQLNDPAGANGALAQILKFYPANNLSPTNVLLVGESLADLNQPAKALALFRSFEKKFPDSSLLPHVQLAVARTYEREGDWTNAVRVYDGWVQLYATNAALLPQVEYARALANFRAGDETNALRLFTNFIAQFPTNGLAPVAQWWIGGHFFRLGAMNLSYYADAEKNYEYVYQKWPASDLAYPARMMAGRAAMARGSYQDAIRYFTSLTEDTNCPADFYVQALFAYGSALMLKPPDDTNKPFANFAQAASVFKTICDDYPTSEQAALAQGEIGECLLQQAAQDTNDYDLASNAYAQVLAATNASVSARAQARVGLGVVLEKRAALASPASQTALLKQARDAYYEAFRAYALQRNEDEETDPFWGKKAGLEAARLDESFQEWPQALAIYRDMIKLWPPLQADLENRIQAILSEHPEIKGQN
jgi:TolA-binding protein